MTAVIRDLTGAGTPEAEWQQAHLTRLPSRSAAELVPAGQRVLLIAPHPDDEVLGAGATVALLASLGHQVTIAAVTDGEASRGGGDHLKAIRPEESRRALARLGLGHAKVHRLHLPDGAVRQEQLRPRLAPLLADADVVLAPWRRDGHPDHDVTGTVSATLGADRGLPVHAYLIWAWHWAAPAGSEIPWSAARRILTPPALLAAKRRAVAEFRSQLTGPNPILPGHVLARLLRPYEVLLSESR